jgi:hypothetical protein
MGVMISRLEKRSKSNFLTGEQPLQDKLTKTFLTHLLEERS